MKSAISLSVLLICLVPFSSAFGQDQGLNANTSSAYCTLEDGKQVSAHYVPVPAKGASLADDKVWLPGGTALTLFTQSGLMLGNIAINPGAYTMYLVPGKKDWKLIVSKNVNVTEPYNQEHDLARASMSVGKMGVDVPQLRITFGHTGPNKCELNVDFGKTKAWVEFTAT